MADGTPCSDPESLKREIRERKEKFKQYHAAKVDQKKWQSTSTKQYEIDAQFDQPILTYALHQVRSKSGVGCGAGGGNRRGGRV